MTRVEVSKRGNEPQEKFASKQSDDATQIIADRIRGNPFTGGGSREIQLKDNSLVCRWFNGAKSSDRIWQAKHQLGWKDVTPDMVRDIEQVGGHDVTGGVITRGERGVERLMCIPKTALEAIQMAKTKANDAQLGRGDRTRAELTERIATEAGPEAAEFVAQHVIGEVVDHVETVGRTDPD